MSKIILILVTLLQSYSNLNVMNMGQIGVNKFNKNSGLTLQS